jgi:hypothetical protein
MGRVGASGDNAAMESFFALLQKNVLNGRSWTTRMELRGAIVVWIEKKYHRKHRQAALSRRSFDANQIRDHDGITGRPGRVTKTFPKTCITPVFHELCSTGNIT